MRFFFGCREVATLPRTPIHGALVYVLLRDIYQTKAGVEFDTLVQAGAGDGLKVFAESFGAGEVAVDVALRLAGDCGGFSGECLRLRRRFPVSDFRWDKLSHLIFRMQRLPYLLPALNRRRPLRRGEFGAAEEPPRPL